LCVSSGVRYAFTSSLNGRLSIITERVLSSTYSGVKAAFCPTHGRRFNATNTVRRSTAGYSARTVPRFTSPEALRRGMDSDFLPREKSERSRSRRRSRLVMTKDTSSLSNHSGTVEDRVSQRRNPGCFIYSFLDNTSYAFILTLKGQAFCCTTCNPTSLRRCRMRMRPRRYRRCYPSPPRTRCIRQVRRDVRHR
jgi:hypothetical protein